MTVPLASSMNADSFLSIGNPVSSLTWRIGVGDGIVGNGPLGDDDLTADSGFIDSDTFRPSNVFPRETAFTVGSLTFDATGFTAVGVETFQITSLDLGEFIRFDPAVLDQPPFNAAGWDPNAISVASDISTFEYARQAAFPDLATGFRDFGPAANAAFLDADDTVTFTDGVLTSVDWSIVFREADGAGLTEDITFGMTGNAFTLEYDFLDGFTQTAADLSGVVGAVGTFVIPAPAAATLVALGGLTLAGRHRLSSQTHARSPRTARGRADR
ncbi:MAG: hypothetical protein AAGJ54_12115 [Planctomycetota bacterium]